MTRVFETEYTDAWDAGVLDIGGVIALSDENSKHVGTVMRLRPGSEIIVCNGRGTDYLCRIIGSGKESGKTVRAEIQSAQANECESPVKLTVFQALPKSDKMDFIIEKAVELGAHSLVPFISEHSVSRPEGDSADNKLRRYRKISEAAAKQCGRGLIPHIGDVTDLRSILGQGGFDLWFAADEKERELSLAAYLSGFTGGVKSAAFFIGPEGGFSDAERGLFKNAGVTPVSLGKRILRSETAAMYVLSCISCFEQNLQQPEPEVWREGIYNRRLGSREEDARKNTDV